MWGVVCMFYFKVLDSVEYEIGTSSIWLAIKLNLNLRSNEMTHKFEEGQHLWRRGFEE